MACYRLTCLNCQRCVTHIFMICTIVLTHLYFLDVHLWTAFLWAYLQVPKADKSDLCLDVLPAQSPYKGKWKIEMEMKHEFQTMKYLSWTLWSNHSEVIEKSILTSEKMYSNILWNVLNKTSIFIPSYGT